MKYIYLRGKQRLHMFKLHREFFIASLVTRSQIRRNRLCSTVELPFTQTRTSLEC